MQCVSGFFSRTFCKISSNIYQFPFLFDDENIEQVLVYRCLSLSVKYFDKDSAQWYHRINRFTERFSIHMDISALYTQIAVMFLLIGVGAVCYKYKLVTDTGSGQMSALLINFVCAFSGAARHQHRHCCACLSQRYRRLRRQTHVRHFLQQWFYGIALIAGVIRR